MISCRYLLKEGYFTTPDFDNYPMDIYLKIKQQRTLINAPVDTLGCYCVDTTLSEELRRFHILVALVLSPRTKDEITHAALFALHAELNPLSPATLLAKSYDDIEKCIHSVGFSKRKTEYLFKISAAVQHAMPESLQDTLRLPGVGRKIAYLYMQHAIGECVGISADTHVHRVSNRIQLVNTITPDKTSIALESILPRDEWCALNTVMVGFGQTICCAPRPKCHLCAARDLCPSSRKDK